MRVRYPRSFFKLLAVGFLLAVLPLTTALIVSTLTIQHLAKQSQQAIFDAARIAHNSRQLAEIAPALERAARQSLVLDDPAWKEGYANLHAEFSGLITEIQRMPLDEPMRGLLQEMQTLERKAFELHYDARPKKGTMPANVFPKLAAHSRELLSYSNDLIAKEAAALEVKAADAYGSARIQLLVVLPVALLIVAGFTYLLAKPIAQIEAGILSLGEQRLQDKIVVEGPEDLVALGERLDWLRQRLNLFEEQKAQFMRHVSHELKTPLTALREGSELLTGGMAGNLQPRQQEIARIVRDNSLHLQHLIEDLLRHGEAEFRAAKVDSLPVNLPVLARQVAEKHEVAMQAREIRLHATVDNVTIQSDPERLRVILDNLISNAVKYSPTAGGIDVSVRHSSGQLNIHVMDDGPGVEESEKELIFEPFFKGANPGSGRIKGTGLGLSICRDHVMALKGSIVVGSGRGDFKVSLPAPQMKG